VGVVRLTWHGAGLRNVAKLMPDLRYLDLQQCPDLEDSDLMELVAARPDIVVFNYYGEQILHPQGDVQSNNDASL